MEQDVAMGNYIIKFILGYTIGLVLLSAIFHIFELEGNSGASIGVLIGVAIYVVGKFIQDHKRVPDKKEKSKLVWSSLVMSWLISIALLIVYVFVVDGGKGLSDLRQLLAEINMIVMVGVIAFVTLINWALLSYSYGGLARKQFEKSKKER